MRIGAIELDEPLYRSLLQFLSDTEIEAIFRALTTPPPRYYIRVNTRLVAPEELIRMLKEKGLDARRDEHLEEAVWMPVEGPFRVPSAGKTVVADKRAAESVYMGADLYAPGVLKTDEVRKGDEVNVLADNGAVVAYGIAEQSSEEVLKERKGLYIRTITSVYRVPKLRNLEEYEAGYFYDQSLPAMWVGALASGLGRTAIDLNAAPGGKATHLAQRGLRVIAFDRSLPKIHRLRTNVERLRLWDKVDVLLHDSRYLSDFPKLKADVALVDPPCSGLGVRPKLYETVKYRDVATLSRYQIQFLKAALRVARYVVYSTCTITFEENERVIQAAGAELLHAGVPTASRGWDCPQCVRFLPHLHGTPGFFIAILTMRAP